MEHLRGARVRHVPRRQVGNGLNGRPLERSERLHDALPLGPYLGLS
jgi:hypothetical protein